MLTDLPAGPLLHGNQVDRLCAIFFGKLVVAKDEEFRGFFTLCELFPRVFEEHIVVVEITSGKPIDGRFE
jgi:hypothetical protein